MSQHHVVSREVRTSRAVTLVVAVAVTVTVAGGFAVARHHDHPTPVAAPAPSPTPQLSTPPRPPVLSVLDPAAPRPTRSALADDLAPAVQTVAAHARVVGEVIDADTGIPLWARSAAVPVPPASTTKLLTATAALTTLGPDFRLSTTTRRVGRTLYLVGGGDPTIVRGPGSFVAPSYPRPASYAQLARRTAAGLGAVRTVRLRLDTSAWSGPTSAPGWKPSYVTEGDVAPPSPLELDEGRLEPRDEFAPRSSDPTAQAGAAFSDLLGQDGVRVVGPVRAGTAPAASQQVAAVSSPPLTALVQRMLTVSDDDLAEALGRTVAIQTGQPATFAGAAAAVTASVASLGVDVAGVSLQDTSGLSHRDRVTSQALVEVLSLAGAASEPQLRSIVEGLPVAGLTGTLSLRYLQPPASVAAGVLRAKTGTLTGVNTLAGVVVDRSGRLLAFAFLASAAPLPGLTVPALDGLASRLARCGCRR